MYFQIAKLIIWPKNDAFAPRVVEFELGKLNVITGLSRTGKSAIIPIIDYCLASHECHIPIDTIRDAAAWYGIVVQLAEDQLLLCRKVPEGNTGSQEFYFQRGKIVSLPSAINERNESLVGIKQMLNTLSAMPYLPLDSNNDKNGFKESLSFRDLMAFLFQPQDTVANQNIFFYKTHSHIHREKLRNWFPYILGAETSDVLFARQQLDVVEKNLRSLTRDFERIKSVSGSWLNNLRSHMQVAREYGLHNVADIDSTSTEDLLGIARDILSDIPDEPQGNLDSIISAAEEIRQLDMEEAALSQQIGKVRKRLSDVDKLKGGLNEYGDSVRRRVERLHISKWLQGISSTTPNSCVACGSEAHPNSRQELEKISKVFEEYEDELTAVAEVPPAFQREEQRLKTELSELLEQKRELEQKTKLLTGKDADALKLLQTRKDMFFFLGHLKASVENFESVSDGSELARRIAALQKEKEDLQRRANIYAVQQRTDAATARIGQKILERLRTLDVEDKYRQVAPKLNIKDLNVQVMSGDGNWHPLAEVGSGSNWVSFHIALMCALQEFFLEMPFSGVPGYVVFDQPSQVYFPRTAKKQTENPNAIQQQGVSKDTNQREVSDADTLNNVNDGTENKFIIPDEDRQAARRLFETISNSIIQSRGNWQAIILDHADHDIYGGLAGVIEKESWDKGTKLVPVEWGF